MAINLLMHHVLVKLEDAIDADDVYKRAKAIGLELQLDKRLNEAVEYGTVIQVGPTAYKDFGFENSPVKVGDRVSLTRYTGKKVCDTDGETYYIYNDQDILCVIE